MPPALVPCSVDDPLHAGRVKKAEVLETERRMLVSLLVMASWKVILGFEQEEMVDKVDVDLAIIIFIMKVDSFRLYFTIMKLAKIFYSTTGYNCQVLWQVT